MLCCLISPDSELILEAKHLGDWEMVAMEVQTKLWQLNPKETRQKETRQTSCIPLTWAPYVDASLSFSKRFHRHFIICFTPIACVVCQKCKLTLRGAD